MFRVPCLIPSFSNHHLALSLIIQNARPAPCSLLRHSCEILTCSSSRLAWSSHASHQHLSLPLSVDPEINGPGFNYRSFARF